jgi:hypothetical protein
MCNVCRQAPCHPQCPNADEPKPIFRCAWCKGEIHYDDYYYEIDDCIVCEDCISKCRKTAE